jgi:hypothetical protein
VGSSYPLVVLTAEADAGIPGFWRVERNEEANFIQYTVFYNHQRVQIPVIRSIVNFHFLSFQERQMHTEISGKTMALLASTICIPHYQWACLHCG